MTVESLLHVSDLKLHYAGRGIGKARQSVRAVDGVSFELFRGETLAIVGESGCGKSSLARVLLGLAPRTDGRVTLDGTELNIKPGRAGRPLRRRVQAIFQDPFSSLNPRHRVRQILSEPILNFGIASPGPELERRLVDLMQQVGLPERALDRLPHEFSGGQRQRICIARALASEAELIICDEAVSALDVSVKAQIINLLADIQQARGVSYLFISHDLAAVENLAHRIAVMYLGRIIEIGTTESLFRAPAHPYTQALMSAVPVPDPDMARNRIVLNGDLPSPIAPPAGCRFHTRCPYAFDRCASEEPQLRPIQGAGLAACHLDALPQAPGDRK